MHRLQPSSTLLVVVDVQEKLAAAMPPAPMSGLIHHALILLEAARLLTVPVLATEQYPKGLGPTVSTLGEKLGAMGVVPVTKMTFDACGEPAVTRAIAEVSPRAVVLLGMETHVCVFQTARELARRGMSVHVVADAVVSRREESRSLGLGLCASAGAIITSAETVVFDWLGRAGTDEFRALSRLLR